MAQTTLYFNEAGAGAQDGTSMANAIAWLYPVTGFINETVSNWDFTTNGPLRCRLAKGATPYDCPIALSGTPSAFNWLAIEGVDAAGAPLVPSYGWTSDQPDFDTSEFPEINDTIDGTAPLLPESANPASVFLRCLKATGTASNAGVPVTGVCTLEWCHIIQANNNSASIAALGNELVYRNSIFESTVASYDTVIRATTSAGVFENIRVRGAGKSAGGSGNRSGIDVGGGLSSAQGTQFNGLTLYAVQGSGLRFTTTSTQGRLRLRDSVIADCGEGITLPSTASQSTAQYFHNLMLTGCTTGLNGGNNSRFYITDSRLRNTTNFTGMGTGSANSPQDMVITTAGSDADEYVDPSAALASRDYRIKAGSAYHGLGYGVSDEPEASGGTQAYAG